jgi:hypothetical protein
LNFIKSRLRHLEEHIRGGRCQECGLSPDERRKIAVVYEEDSQRSFQGDPYEQCVNCGRPLWCVLRVVYEDAGGNDAVF